MSKSKSESWFHLPGLTNLRHVRSKRRAKPGSQPGVISVDPESPKPKISILQFGANSASELVDVTVDQVAGMLNQDSVTWVNVDGLGDEKVIQSLGDLF